MKEKPSPRGRIPKGLSLRDRMERKLLTKRGRALYKKRSQTVEPVFSQIKEGQRFRRFMQRGKEACNAKWKLACTTHNLLKLWRRFKERKIERQATLGLSAVGVAATT